MRIFMYMVAGCLLIYPILCILSYIKGIILLKIYIGRYLRYKKFLLDKCELSDPITTSRIFPKLSLWFSNEIRNNTQLRIAFLLEANQLDELVDFYGVSHLLPHYKHYEKVKEKIYNVCSLENEPTSLGEIKNFLRKEVMYNNLH